MSRRSRARRRLRRRCVFQKKTCVAYAADDAYSAELRRLFGKAAGDARYDARGMSTPELRRLSDAKLAADAAMLRNGLVTRRQ
jgi:hypothetical protein